MDKNQLISIQNEIYRQIKLNEHKLLKIKEKTCSLMEKWQDLLQVILPIQMDAIKAYSLGDGQAGLSKFNEAYAHAALDSSTLRELNTKKWLLIFDKAFGMTEYREISLGQAQSLIKEIREEMTSEPFLLEVDQAIHSLESGASMVEKRQAVLTILFPLHMSVMRRHGFEGEKGYVQAQRAIMDYYHDPEISKMAAQAQSVVFKRAQLIS